MSMKYVRVGRHPLTGLQKALLASVGLEEEVGHIERLGVTEAIEIARQNNASIVVEGIPIWLLATLFREAEKYGIEVLGFEKKSLGIMPCSEVFESFHEADIVLERDNGVCKVQKTKGLVRYTNIAYDFEWLVRA